MRHFRSNPWQAMTCENTNLLKIGVSTAVFKLSNNGSLLPSGSMRFCVQYSDAAGGRLAAYHTPAAE